MPSCSVDALPLGRIVFDEKPQFGAASGTVYIAAVTWRTASASAPANISRRNAPDRVAQGWRVPKARRQKKAGFELSVPQRKDPSNRTDGDSGFRFRERDRGFESFSLHQRVHCEPDFLDGAVRRCQGHLQRRLGS